MKELTFEVRFIELRKSGEQFEMVIDTNTEYIFMLSRNPNDNTETAVGISAFTEWTFADGGSAILQCVCGAYPKAFMIEDMSFDEYKTVVEAAIGQVNLKLPDYLDGTQLPQTLEIAPLTEHDIAKMGNVYLEFTISDGPHTSE